jgi:hypothetical protein
MGAIRRSRADHVTQLCAQCQLRLTKSHDIGRSLKNGTNFGPEAGLNGCALRAVRAKD